MIALRVFFAVVLAVVAWCAGGYLLTRDRKYLRLAVRALVLGAVGALLLFALLVVQRI